MKPKTYKEINRKIKIKKRYQENKTDMIDSFVILLLLLLPLLSINREIDIERKKERKRERERERDSEKWETVRYKLV